jgi:hypothetical protein
MKDWRGLGEIALTTINEMLKCPRPAAASAGEQMTN